MSVLRTICSDGEPGVVEQVVAAGDADLFAVVCGTGDKQEFDVLA